VNAYSTKLPIANDFVQVVANINVARAAIPVMDKRAKYIDPPENHGRRWTSHRLRFEVDQALGWKYHAATYQFTAMLYLSHTHTKESESMDEISIDN
jgi:hypothetical protein